MVLSTRFAIAALSTGLVVGPFAASAHDLWITLLPDGGQFQAVVNFGHPDERSLPELEKLVTLDVISGGCAKLLRGGKFSEGHSVTGAPVLITADFSMPSDAELISASYDNGYYVKTGVGYLNTSLRLAPDAKHSIWAPKFTKTLLGPGGYATVVGHEIELVPIENPFTLASGAVLHVKVIFRGQPLAGEKIELGDGVTPVKDADIARFTTDAGGVASIPIKGGGEVLLTVDHEVPGANPTLAATDAYNASLEFVLK